MKFSRALTAAAIVAVAMIPIGAASADRGDDRDGRPGQHWKDRAPTVASTAGATITSGR